MLGLWAQEQFNLQRPLSQRTVSNILSSSEKIYELATKGKGATKSAKELKLPGLDQDIETFITDMSHRNEPVNRASILLFAKLTANQKYKMNEWPQKDRLTFFEGWLTDVFKRIGVKSRHLYGEEGSVDIPAENIQQQLKKIGDLLLKDYKPQDIFNFDETGLYYEQQPTRTICKTPLGGAKKSKNRLTIGLLTNSDGSYKGHPLVIGKGKKPRGASARKALFNKMCIGSADYVEYHHQPSAWMSADIFKNYIRRLNRSFQRDNDRKIALLVDNASVHKVNEEFSNIKLIFLPANTTSKLQPLDAGNKH